MEKEAPREFDVELHFPAAQWQFWGIAREQLLKVDWYGRFAETRILQRYLETCNYELLFFLHAWTVTKHRRRWLKSAKDLDRIIRSKQDPVERALPQLLQDGIPIHDAHWYRSMRREPDTEEAQTQKRRWKQPLHLHTGPDATEILTHIESCHHSNRHIIDSRLGFTYPEVKDLRFNSMSVIDMRYLRDQTAHRFKDLGKKTTDLIPIRDVSKVWHDLGENMKANVQAWMRKTKRKDGQESGPIFIPIERAEASDPRGSMLDFADVVTIGLIHWLLRHGARYSDFEGTPKVTILG